MSMFFNSEYDIEREKDFRFGGLIQTSQKMFAAINNRIVPSYAGDSVLMDKCHKNGLRIPEDVFIMSLEDIWCTESEGISLATANQHVEEMGSHASRFLLNQFKGENLPPTLIKEIPRHEGDRGVTLLLIFLERKKL